MDRFIILVNDGIVGGGKVFNNDGLIKHFDEWSNGEDLIDENENIISIDDLKDSGGYGEKIEICNESMVEMGDDVVEISIVKLDFS